MTEHYQFEPEEWTLAKTSAKFMHFHSRECMSKCRLRNGGTFLSASMCWCLLTRPSMKDWNRVAACRDLSNLLRSWIWKYSYSAGICLTLCLSNWSRKPSHWSMTSDSRSSFINVPCKNTRFCHREIKKNTRCRIKKKRSVFVMHYWQNRLSFARWYIINVQIIGLFTKLNSYLGKRLDPFHYTEFRGMQA